MGSKNLKEVFFEFPSFLNISKKASLLSITFFAEIKTKQEKSIVAMKIAKIDDNRLINTDYIGWYQLYLLLVFIEWARRVENRSANTINATYSFRAEKRNKHARVLAALHNLVPRGRDPFGQKMGIDKRDPWGRGCCATGTATGSQFEKMAGISSFI